MLTKCRTKGEGNPLCPVRSHRYQPIKGKGVQSIPRPFKKQNDPFGNNTDYMRPVKE